MNHSTPFFSTLPDTSDFRLFSVLAALIWHPYSWNPIKSQIKRHVSSSWCRNSITFGCLTVCHYGIEFLHQLPGPADKKVVIHIAHHDLSEKMIRLEWFSDEMLYLTPSSQYLNCESTSNSNWSKKRLIEDIKSVSDLQAVTFWSLLACKVRAIRQILEEFQSSVGRTCLHSVRDNPISELVCFCALT